MQLKSLLNIKGKETVALIGLNVMVITGLILFYVLVLRNNLPANTNEVLGTTACASNYVEGITYHDKASYNGKKGSGEEAIANIDVEVKLSNNKVYKAKTAADGTYKICFDEADSGKAARLVFSGLPAGHYPGPHGDQSDTLVSFFSTGGKANVSLGMVISGEGGDRNVPVEIGNRVWHDANSNGLQDPGEQGIDGVNLKLVDYDNPSKEIASANTSNGGIFYFKTNVDAGSRYLIRIKKEEFDKGQPLNNLTTTKIVTSDGNLNSDAPSGQKGTKDIDFPVIIGTAESCNVCIHGYDIGLTGTRTTAAVTPTPYSEPAFPACPANYEKLGEFSGNLFADRSPMTLTHDINLSKKTDELLIKGYVTEGHPEARCPSDDPNSLCNQPQSQEEFKLEIDGDEIYRYADKGPGVNLTSSTGDIKVTNLAQGTKKLIASHLHPKSETFKPKTAESVAYKISVCAKYVTSTTVTSTPSVTATASSTPTNIPTATVVITGASVTPTATPSVTSTPEITATATPTSTPVPSVSITGASVTPTSEPAVSGAATIAPSGVGGVGSDPDLLPAAGLNYPIIIGFAAVALGLGGGLLYLARNKKFKIRLSRFKR